MDLNQSLSNEFNDIFDIDRDIKLAEELSKRKNLKEKNDRLIKELMEYQDKIASEREKNS